jgi:hypothetical protein
MSTEGTDTPVAAAKTTLIPAASSERQNPPRIGEGLGVFRALLIMVLFYVAFGFLAWFGWHAFKQWRSH